MAVCTYDNPNTMARECWQNGRLLCFYRASILPPLAKKPIPADIFFMGANVGEWQECRIVGDSSAMETSDMSQSKF